jgi:putative ABC transport system substrate-binding protein
MRRRKFLTLLGSGLLWPASGQSQDAAMPVLGLLSGTMREASQIAAIQKGLAEAGYVEGRNLKIEYRWAEGDFDRLPALAQDLVQRQVAAILAIQSPRASLAAKAATTTIPVIFSIGGDPVGLGLVPSLARPGGNVTGATFLVNTLGAKRLELLRELVPGAKLAGLLINPKNPSAAAESKDVQEAAAAYDQRLQVARASTPAEIEAAFSELAQAQVNALVVAADSMFNARRQQLITAAAKNGLPAIYFIRDFVEQGGLMSYGGSPHDAYRLAGIYVGRILKGEKPADLPVQQSTKVELLINMKTAKASGISVPATLLARADEVIE